MSIPKPDGGITMRSAVKFQPRFSLRSFWSLCSLLTAPRDEETLVVLLLRNGDSWLIVLSPCCLTLSYRVTLRAETFQAFPPLMVFGDLFNQPVSCGTKADKLSEAAILCSTSALWQQIFRRLYLKYYSAMRIGPIY